MARAYSVSNIYNAKFKTMPFNGIWKDAIGEPELTGCTFIYGPPKNGKTSFALMYCKYLTQFERVTYNSIEEGLSLSMKEAIERVEMQQAGSRFTLLDKEPINELVKRLERHKSPNIVTIDSVQFAELTFEQYKMLKARFPNKHFIYISHIDGKQPDGTVARRIWRDANIAIRVEGFKAFPTGRYGGGKPITISQNLADDYWGLKID